MMRAYAEHAECRRRFLLAYFGEQYVAERCGFCDNDRAADSEEANGALQEPNRPQAPAQAPVTVPFQAGDRVSHEEWGTGVVQLITDDRMTVLFDEGGYRTLDSRLVLERDLLSKVNNR